MKKKLLNLIILSMILLAVGCSKDSSKQIVNKNYLKEIDKYIYEIKEYKSLDYKFADNYFKKNYDNWSGGCSAITKIVNGHRLIGRNMDLNISNKCAYIIRTKTGKHKTVGLTYTFRDISPDYNKVKKSGISKEFYKVLPFMCDDVINDSGLHVEINMRHDEYWPNGDDKFSCKGTNKKSDKRVYMFELPRYIAENCSSVKEAKKYVNTLDIYSKNHYWNYSFLISDAKGESSVLELSSNKIYWIDEAQLSNYNWLNIYNVKAIGQTNFYLNENDWKIQDIKTGEGRFTSLQNGIDSVNSKSDMYDLIRKVQYSSYYLDYDECKNNHFDPRSEIVGELPRATYDSVMNPSSENIIKEELNNINSSIREVARKEKQKANTYWESSFTEVIDTNEKTMFVRMFENEKSLFLIDLNKTKKISNIKEWK